MYLANLEVKDSEGKLLEIMPQRDPACGQGLLCIRYTIQPNEQKTIVMTHTFRFPVEYGGINTKLAFQV